MQGRERLTAQGAENGGNRPAGKVLARALQILHTASFTNESRPSEASSQ
jgi:hypothetical protein